MRTLGAMIAAAMIVAACKDKPKPGADDPLFRDYAANDSSGRIPIGGVDVWGYCKAHGSPTVGYQRGYIEGKQAAYNNWVCQSGAEQLKPVNAKPVDMLTVCQWQYKQAKAARPDDPNHAWSWNCFAK